MRKLITTIIATILALSGIGVAQAAWTPNSTPSARVEDENIIVRTAIIRVGPKVYLHTNSTHGSIGVRAIQQYNGGIKVTFDGRKPGEKILSATAEEDESISRLGVQAGFTGNVTTGVIYLYKGGKKVSANNSAFGNYSNIWLTVISQVPPA